MIKVRSIENLQKALSMELTATHQYQLHAGVLDDWGLNLLATKMREEMTEELGHSDTFMNRIMFLHGEPEMTLDASPHLSKSLKEMFEKDLADEKEAVEFYTKASKEASDDGDIGTKAIFEQTVIDEEQHASWLELQLDLLEKLGESVYIAKHMSEPSAG